MTYKQSIHGHKAEFSKTWSNLWYNWHPEITEANFHPCSTTVWLKIEHFDRSKLPEKLKKHVYYNKELI